MSLARPAIGQGPDLVMLHGWAMHSGVMQGFAERLAADFRVTPLDLPGHGHSADPSANDLDHWADAALASAPPTAIWLGWSLGGLVALRAAQRAPARVTQLVLLASTPSFVQREGWDSATLPTVFDAFSRSLKRDVDHTVTRFLSLQMGNDPEGRTHLRELRAVVDGAPAARPAALSAGLHLLGHTDLRAELADLPTPSLWLFGARDTLVPAAAAGQIQALQPGAQTRVLDGASHVPFLSHPEQCHDALREFAGG